jgi:16S rRNA processing protein RimM
MTVKEKAQKKGWHLVGKVHSAQGVRGQVFVFLFGEAAPWLEQWDTLVLSDDETKASHKREYPIDRVQPHSKQGKKGFILTLKHVTDKDVADSFAKKFVWIPTSFLISKKGETIYLREIENFIVMDKSRGEVGPIVGFSSNGPQDLLQVQSSTGNYDIPFVEAFIVKIDFENEQVHMDIPLGLLEDV